MTSSLAADLKTNHNDSVSMLNLMHFFDTPQAIEQHHAYGRSFAEVGGKRGGNDKFVGIVVKPPDNEQDSRGRTERELKSWWNQCSLVHYLTIDHFCDMAADEDQHINQQHRIGALRDTTLICTAELDLSRLRAKL